jgi:sugar phosphate permease
MARELGFGDRVFGLAAGIFFVSYVALQVPGALLVERWSARRMISASLITWGLLTTLTALVRTPGQLYLARFVLGAAEAGFFPGVVVYLSHWFIQEDRAKASSNFMAAIPLSLVIGSPIAGWILGHRWLAIEGWRWMFVMEGMPAVVLGVVAFFFLTDWPKEAGWLALEQRQWIGQKLEEARPARRETILSGQALRSQTILLLAAAVFLDYFAGYAVVFWLPTVLKNVSGFSDLRVGLLGAVPYAVALIAMLINGWHSDRRRERRWHSAIPLFVTGAALLGLTSFSEKPVLMVLAFSMVNVNMAALPVFFAIPTEVLRESAAAVGTINAVGSVAGFVGPYVFGYLHARTGSLAYGATLLMLAAFAAGILFLLIPSHGKHSSKSPAD